MWTHFGRNEKDGENMVKRSLHLRKAGGLKVKKW